ncbi:PREDICTED: DALR anticodon-binding domain-containing protein 3 [Nanorana parkeri]|uniref:DALR anticodon-binding domain-containing protein 3 n=1 Tax=Nanorana parkeri TaxID=125878 RepID=UPI000854AA40|nr:PREDICTED: DALR anticodon-binding domain-containing protein 3 [Nanorana parkeri]
METGDSGESGPLWVSETLRVLGAALRECGAPSAVWFKESSQKNLKSRDFLVPRGALRNSFPEGEVPAELIQKLTTLNVPGILPVKRCQLTDAGLVIQLDRPDTFSRILRDFTPYLRPLPSSSEGVQAALILNCVPLHACTGLGTFKLSHLRAVLVADHLAEVLRLSGKQVRLIPPIRNKEVGDFLKQLGITWPSVAESPDLDQTISRYKYCLKEELGGCSVSGDSVQPADESSPSVLFRVHLKSCSEEHGLCLEGYDPNIDHFLVTEEDLTHVARLENSVKESVKGAEPCAVLHVVSREEEFHQQKLDLLWRLLEPGAASATQKHLICGPVTVLTPQSPVSCSQYFHLRKSQMHKASVMKYGDCVQGDSWDEIITSLTSAAIKFELMATPHRTQVNLNLEEANITTKGTKSGAFVMYNCARLSTLFDSYNSAVSQGLYPEFPSAAEFNYSSLSEEGEWLLLFNYIMTFPEVLSEAAQISLTSPGIRVTATTEAICKFLVSLSMDFSCYYNRVHILGEPLPHLFGLMFARLQLMNAIRSLLHSALSTLHIQPPAQI